MPQDFLERRRIPAGMDYWLDERNGELILHPCLPDVRKLYVEPTTACNLRCHTCIRNIWGDPIAHMSMATFNNLEKSLIGLPKK